MYAYVNTEYEYSVYHAVAGRWR